jgi:hypothetical protein
LINENWFWPAKKDPVSSKRALHSYLFPVLTFWMRAFQKQTALMTKQWEEEKQAKTDFFSSTNHKTSNTQLFQKTETSLNAKKK